MYYLKKIKKCQYTGEKYHILYLLEYDADLKDISLIKNVDDLFENDDFLKRKKIIGFSNIHKITSISRYGIDENEDFHVSKLMFHPSSVYIRKDCRQKGLGKELYINILSALHRIHTGKTKSPLLLQHEQAEKNWATTSDLSKKIYQFLEKKEYITRYQKYCEDGWYKLNFSNIPDNNIQILED